MRGASAPASATDSIVGTLRTDGDPAGPRAGLRATRPDTTLLRARNGSGRIDLLVYSHVQGYWVHDAGRWTVFDWPERCGIHPREILQGGDWFSVEFRTRTAVPEWGNQLVSMQREEDAITSKTARPLSALGWIAPEP